MRIKVIFSNNFNHQQVDKQPIYLDADPNESISNLKILISLKYTDLDPEYIELLFRNTPIKETNTCIYLQTLMPPPNEITVTCQGRTNTCCTIF